MFSKTIPSEPTEQQKRAMEHGSVNEINAVATVVSKILPVYYPDHCFYEEGAYSVKNDKGETVMIVSPDGCIKDSHSVISVEIKCPFPSYAGVTPVYYCVKPRHVIQCCLEADVLKAREHLYVSWSKESTTVFKMKPNQHLVESVIEEVQNVYYGDYPSVPTKLSDKARLLKQLVVDEAEKAEFLGEFVSVTAHCSVRSQSLADEDSVYYHQQGNEVHHERQSVWFETVVQYLHKAIKQVSEAYEYQKPMASEVLVYLISDMDRTWNREIGHGLPISYLFKGYSLSMGTARRILEEVLNECHQSGVHVPCVCFDGQFARLKDFDKMETPLSLFALQRQFWTEVQRLPKRKLILEICEMFQTPTWFSCQDAHVDHDGTVVSDNHYIVIENFDKKVLPIQTSYETLRKKPAGNNTAVQVSSQIDLFDSAGLDDDVLSVIQEAGICIPPFDGSLTAQSDCINHGEPHTEVNTADRNSRSTGHELESHITLSLHDYNFIHEILKDTKRNKWKNMNVKEIIDIFASAVTMNKELTGHELSCIVKFLNLKEYKYHNFSES